MPVGKRLTMRKLSAYQSIGKEIEDRCEDIVNIYNEEVIKDEDEYLELLSFDVVGHNVEIIMTNYTAREVTIKIPNDMIVLHWYKSQVRDYLRETPQLTD